MSAVEKKQGRKATALCVSVDRKAVVAGFDDGSISTWDVETGRMKETGVPGQSDGVRSIAMSNDNQYVVSGSWDRSLRVWNTMTGRQVGDALCGHEGLVYAVAISHDWVVSICL